jgi:hypothetical protein
VVSPRFSSFSAFFSPLMVKTSPARLTSTSLSLTPGSSAVHHLLFPLTDIDGGRDVTPFVTGVHGEAVEEALEHSVHLAPEGHERIEVVLTLCGRLVFLFRQGTRALKSTMVDISIASVARQAR